MQRDEAARRPSPDNPAERSVLTRAVQHITDADTDPVWGQRFREEAQVRGFRSLVAVPMLRGDDVVGAIGVTRERAGGFLPVEIALLQTFADQAVIAVENARLLDELQATQRRSHRGARAADGHQRDPARHQPARRPTSSRCSTRSPRARRACARLWTPASSGVDGDGSLLVAHHGFIPRTARRVRASPHAAGHGERPRRCSTRARSTWPTAGRGEEFPESSETAPSLGLRTILYVPADAGRAAIGAISLRRTEVSPSPTARSRCCRPSPTRPSSPSRTSGCSRSWRRATAS